MFNGNRIQALTYIFLAPFLILVFFLFRFQLVEGETYQKYAEHNSIRVQTIFPTRGEIYDRHFRPIAINEPSHNLYILPAKLTNLSETAKFINQHLPIPEEEIKELIFQSRFRAYQELIIYRNVDFQKVVEMSEQLNNYPSLFFKTEHVRNYSINNHFSGYISKINRTEFENYRAQFPYSGYTINCQIGKTGIEREYETVLRGKPGRRLIQVDSSGKLFKENPADEEKNQVQHGKDILLTIDLQLQNYIESVFPKGYNGAVLVLDTETGGILSYVSRPVFDLNMFSRTLSRDYWDNLVTDPSFPLMDRVTMATYPPASLFKIMMTGTVLDNNIISPETKLAYCTGSYQYGNRVYRCWNPHGHGSLNLSDAIKHSCNVYFFDLSMRVELPLIENFVKNNYLLDRTGIDLPTERTGFFPSEEWYIERLGSKVLITGHKINLSIGQGEVLLTPIEIGAFYNAIANNGEWTQPHLFSRFISPDKNNEVYNKPKSTKRLDITPSTLSFIQNSLYRAVNETGGTGLGARVQGAKVYGKTGTAQNPAGRNPHTWFAGYAGWDKPEITIVVLFENYPGTGGGVAAPFAGQIIKFYQDNVRQLNGTIASNY
ncbi:MAG: penicillin-binding protein 2 [Candidatus Cloacimonetes bacterium]|nr:penicillin-binding protein 2 [Candidatus Cloacimonadota bacterium]